MRTQNPAVVARVNPIAVSVQLFRAPDVIVVIAVALFITKTLRQIVFALAHPTVPLILLWRARELPVACVRSIAQEFSRATVAQSKAGGFGIDARAPVIAHGQSHAAVAGNINSIETFFFGGESRAGRVNFKVFFVVVEARETKRGSAFRKTESDAFVAQRDDLERGVGADAHEIARVNLDFELRFATRSQLVAFDERQVKRGVFPSIAAVAEQLHVALDETDAHDTRGLVVFICLVLVRGARRGPRDERGG